MNEKEFESLIKKVSSNVSKEHELLKEARDLSSEIDFNELKNVIDIEKYQNTVHLIAQDLSFMQVKINNARQSINCNYKPRRRCHL